VDWARKHAHYAGELTREAESRRHQRTHRLGRHPLYLRNVHLGVRAARGDPSRSVERLCLARGIRYAAELAKVMGLMRGGLWRRPQLSAGPPTRRVGAPGQFRCERSIRTADSQ
jgi:hypothetical protein